MVFALVLSLKSIGMKLQVRSVPISSYLSVSSFVVFCCSLFLFVCETYDRAIMFATYIAKHFVVKKIHQVFNVQEKLIADKIPSKSLSNGEIL